MMNELPGVNDYVEAEALLEWLKPEMDRIDASSAEAGPAGIYDGATFS